MLSRLSILPPRASIGLVILLLCLGSAPVQAQGQSTPQGAQLTAAGGDVQFGPPPTAAWAALINRLHASDLESARSMGEGANIITMALVDLDNDGYPELITTVRGGGFCGSRGCKMAIFRRGASGWTEPSVLDVITDEVNVGPPQSPGKWRTLQFNKSRIWAFNGKKYDIVP